VIQELRKKNRCNRGTVRNIFQRFLQRGHLLQAPKGRPIAKLDDFATSFLVALVDHHAKSDLKELQLLLEFYLDLEEFEIPSVQSISEKLVEMGLTMKNLEVIADRRLTPENKYCRAAFIAWRSTVPMDQIFFIDETGICGNSGYRKRGRSGRGQRIFDVRRISGARQRYNIVACCGASEGMVSVVPVVGSSINAGLFNVIFANFILPFLPRGSFVCR